MIESTVDDAPDGDEGFDDDAVDFDLAPARKAVSSGVMTPEEAVRHWNMSAAEAKALGTGPGRGAQAAIKAPETELAELRALKRADPKAYDDNDVQKRELRVIDKLHQRAITPATIIAAAMEPLNAVDAELAEIAKARKADFAGYRKDAAMQDRELTLLRQREEMAGEVKILEGLNAVVAPVLETAADREAFSSEFDTMYSSLPESGQEAMRAVLGGDVIEPSRPASEAQVETFATSDIGGELVQEWGRNAPKKLAMVRASIDQMIMRGGNLDSAFAWFDKLPAEQAKAIVRSLAR